MHIVDEKNTKYHAASLWAQKKQNCSAWKKINKDTPAADVEKVLGKSKKNKDTLAADIGQRGLLYIYVHMIKKKRKETPAIYICAYDKEKEEKNTCC